MLSSFTLCESGYGFKHSDAIMKQVNDNSKGKQYSDKDAAEFRSSNGSAEKTYLDRSPFTCEFEYVCNNNRYWTYKCMVMQMEDSLNVSKVAFPYFDYIFYLTIVMVATDYSQMV